MIAEEFLVTISCPHNSQRLQRRSAAFSASRCSTWCFNELSPACNSPKWILSSIDVFSAASALVSNVCRSSTLRWRYIRCEFLFWIRRRWKEKKNQQVLCHLSRIISTWIRFIAVSRLACTGHRGLPIAFELPLSSSSTFSLLSEWSYSLLWEDSVLLKCVELCWEPVVDSVEYCNE